MPFAYYRRLSPRQRRIYDQSDRVDTVTLPDAPTLQPVTACIEQELKAERRDPVRVYCQQLADGITDQFGVPPVIIKVLAARPSDDWGELHGEYELAEGRTGARITVWMRTAKRRQVVAFRSFLRTVLHELCHHLDYTLLRLEDSFHTDGFYKREASLFRALVPEQREPGES